MSESGVENLRIRGLDAETVLGFLGLGWFGFGLCLSLGSEKDVLGFMVLSCLLRVLRGWESRGLAWGVDSWATHSLQQDPEALNPKNLKP